MPKNYINPHNEGSNITFRNFKKALQTDGSNDFIQLPNFLGLPAGQRLTNTSSYSLSIWVKGNGFLLGNIFADTNPYSAPNSVWNMGQQWGFINGYQQLILSVEVNLNGRGCIFVGNTTFDDTKWNHFIITYDGSRTINGARCYLNGRLIINWVTNFVNTQLSTDTTYINHNYPYLLQRYPSNNDGYYKSDLSDLIIFNRVLTIKEVRLLYNRGQNDIYSYYNYGSALLNSRVLHYSFDANNYQSNTPVGQATVLDLSGNNRNGIIQGQGSNPTLVNFY